MKKKSKDKETCTWTINNFPRALKNRFLAHAKSENQTGLDLLQFIVERLLRENFEKVKKEIIDHDW